MTALPQGVTLFCDPTLAPAMRGLDGAGGFPVAVLSAPASLMLAQITRHTRNDVLFTLGSAMDQAAAAKLVDPATRLGGFVNSFVLAGRAGGAASISRATVAVTDDTPASGLDGRAILAANGLKPRAILGAANTADAAFLVLTGAADAALVYLTDVQADPRLAVLATLAADPALTAYEAAVNAHAVSPNAAEFLGVLRGASAALRAAGLAVAA